MAYRARGVSQNLEIPSAWPFCGLVPLGVGLAYLTYYRSVEARKEPPIN